MRTVNQAQLSAYIVHYSAALVWAVETHPDEYGYGIEMVPLVVAKMRRAMETGSYNHDSRAFRKASRALGLKPTRGAIEAFIGVAK